MEPTQAPTPAPTVMPTIVASGPCVDVDSDAFVIVSSRANIWGAGHDEAPSPGGGGGGELPPLVDLEVSEGTEVSFPCTSGTVDCCSGSMFSAPAGPEGSVWSTRISPYQGLSGILHDKRGVFLAGVFVGEDEPADPAPKSLDFTELCPAECTFETLEPELGQIFYIGLGGEESAYVAPAGASRLYLGIPDAEFVQGAPGWYGNNAGHFEVAVDVR